MALWAKELVYRFHLQRSAEDQWEEALEVLAAHQEQLVVDAKLAGVPVECSHLSILHPECLQPSIPTLHLYKGSNDFQTYCSFRSFRSIPTMLLLATVYVSLVSLMFSSPLMIFPNGIQVE